MQFDWILSPLTQFVLMGLGFAGALSLWIGAQMELRNLRGLLREYKQSSEAGLGCLTTRLEEITSSKPLDPLPSLPSAPNSLNLTKRTQALRMHRRGESLASIAGALLTPQSEVALLLKLNQILEPENVK
jgi:hypothetical protein